MQKVKTLLFIRHIISISVVGLNLSIVSVFEELILIDKHLVLFSKCVLYTLNVVISLFTKRRPFQVSSYSYTVHILVCLYNA